MSIDLLHSVYIVWEEDPNRDITFKRNTISFDPSVILNNPAEPTGGLAVAATQYNVYAVWYNLFQARFSEIYYRRSTDGGANFAWTENLSNTAGYSNTPVIAASGNNVHVVWTDNTPGDWDIFYRGSTNGGDSFGSTTNLSNNSGRSLFPTVAASEDNVYVVWTDNTPGNSDIFYRRSTNSGASFGSTVNISNSAPNSGSPAVAASNNLT